MCFSLIFIKTKQAQEPDSTPATRKADPSSIPVPEKYLLFLGATIVLMTGIIFLLPLVLEFRAAKVSSSRLAPLLLTIGLYLTCMGVGLGYLRKKGDLDW